MGKEFVVDMGYPGYVYLGCAEGLFEARDGQKRPYYNMYVMSPVSAYESEDYRARGLKAEKKKCLCAEVWDSLEPGDRVKLFFDDKGRVIAAGRDED